jgi:hypothetical protein
VHLFGFIIKPKMGYIRDPAEEVHFPISLTWGSK